MLLRIIPKKLKYGVEPCTLEIKSEDKNSEFYPVAVVHIDNFWQGRDGENKVYNLLNAEKVVILEISLTPLALDEGDSSNPKT